MGSKRCFADAILRRFGLERGQGADFDYLWVDADLGVQNYLTALSDAEFREQVLLELEPFSWHDPMDDLRPLWRQQKALGAFTEVSPSECARYLFLLQGAFSNRSPFTSEGYVNAKQWFDLNRSETSGGSIHAQRRGALRKTTDRSNTDPAGEHRGRDRAARPRRTQGLHLH
jgi:hypothetical protein